MTVKMIMMMMVKTKAKLLGESVNLKQAPIEIKQRSKKTPNKLILHCPRGEMVQAIGLQWEPLIGYRTKTKWFLTMKG